MVYERIRNLREDNDFSQSFIADYLHCSQVAYSYYELGRRDIPVSVVIKLSEFYGCSTDYLLGLTNKKERNI